MSEPMPTLPEPPRPIQVEVTVRLDLAAEEAWPDGPPPGRWGAEHVLDELLLAGTPKRMLEEWDLLALGVDVQVTIGRRTVRGRLP